MDIESPLSSYAAAEKEEVLRKISSSLKGLSNEEAKKRISLYGQNEIAGKKEYNIIIEFLSHFKSPLVLILLIAAVVAFYFGEIVDSIIIGVIILLSVSLDFFLEYNAEKASEKLKEGVQTKAIVIREGKEIEINYTDLAIGDIIFLNAGSLIPADARIISSKDFFVNQSSLTGESLPCEKIENAIEGSLSLQDMKNIAFMGTNVVSGSATAVIVKIGKNTEYGKIASKLSEKSEKTDFERGISDFGFLVTKAIIFLVLFIFLFNSIVKGKVLESFMFAIAVAVGLTPELLPMIMSITMAKGSLNMAKKGVIVKKLNSIPNFGSMDILCTDKTGTLTLDKIELVKYVDLNGDHSEHILEFAYLNSHFQTGIRNPLDDAVLSYKKMPITGYKKRDEIPFDFVRKKMSVVVDKGKKTFLIAKGAPESIIESSTSCFIKGKRTKIDKKTEKSIIKLYNELSSDGYRVLAVASKETSQKRVYDKEDESDLILMGFVAFLDPPKHDAKQVIKELKEIGVEVKIITGDNELVTKRICDELSIEVKGILLGHELDALTDDALRIRVERTTIFARFSPDEKNRIIHALKLNGHVVGYMGDGINDAPSLKTADIGISVNSAVDIAKESAAIVLTKKSLHVLKDGILDGRKTFSNTMKYIMMNLSSNFGNMFSVAGAVLFLPFLPMLPIQILLNNFIYDFSQITIPGDNVDDEMTRKPKRWNLAFIKKFMLFFGPASSVFDFLTFFVLLGIFHLEGGYFQTGWFMESLATQTLVIHIIRTKNTPFLKSRASKALMISSIACVIIGWIIPYTPIGRYLGFQILPWYIVLTLLGIVVAYLVTVELLKRQFYKHNDL